MYYNNNANKFKQKFFEERDNGKADETLKETKGQRKHAKKMAKHYLKQYDELKKEMDYKSLESSDDSLSM